MIIGRCHALKDSIALERGHLTAGLELACVRSKLARRPHGTAMESSVSTFAEAL